VNEPWCPEHVVDADLAREMVEARFPQLMPARVEPLGAGWDSTAYLVNEVWVFRFPRRSVAVSCLEQETRLLPSVAPRVPLPVPVPELATTGS
jgi:aminoglycoside phosphotransferase (APT) family kinase protein